MYADQFEIYHGNANPELARKIARYLGAECGKAEVFQFANENIFVKILDNVREKDVFLVQPTSHPVNQSIMELLIMIDAFKRASAPAGSPRSSRSTPTAGRTRRTSRACPITARLIADMITRRRRRPGPDDGPPPGPDPGLLQHPGRRADRGPHAVATTSSTSTSRTCVVVTDLGFAKRARTFAELARRAAGDHREAPRRQPRPGRADERHRRGQGQAGDHRRRRDRHRRAR